MYAIIPTLRKAIRAVAPLVLVTACADRSEGPRVPEDGADLGAPHVPWAKKNREERMAYMAAHVYPSMQKLFQEFDPKTYADFSCQTCHGEDMEAKDYAMPGDLYELPGDDPIADAMEYDEDVAGFMKDKVAPTMSHLLSQDAPAGKACFTCHPKSD